MYTIGDKDWLKINAGQKALVRVSHSTEMTSRLSIALTDQTLPPVDRAALLLDAYALAKAGMCIYMYSVYCTKRQLFVCYNNILYTIDYIQYIYRIHYLQYSIH